MAVSTSWQGSLRDLAKIVNSIRRSRAFGRLTVRNTDRLGVAHLYFRYGKLVHIVSHRGDAEAILADLPTWTRATVRFERSASIANESITEEQEQLFDSVLLQLQIQGVVTAPPTPRVVEGDVVASSHAGQLVTPQEWQVLIEGMHRVSLAVAHLIGPQEVMTVLRDILADCSAVFPAFSGLQIAPSGYLQVVDGSKLNSTPREELLEGFATLITTCQHFCSPIIGERDAHQLMIQALGDVCPALVSLGVFQVDNELLSYGYRG
jgi:hypothetical protein